MASGEEPKREVELTTEGTCLGFPLVIKAMVEIRIVPDLLKLMRKVGIEPKAQPLVFARTAEGLPICPEHGVVMRRHEKQGDEWFSHRVRPRDGVDLWCRGYPDPVSSPGFFHEMVGPDPKGDEDENIVLTPPSVATAPARQRPAELPLPAAPSTRGAYTTRPPSRRRDFGPET